jgi:hypothetical protein
VQSYITTAAIKRLVCGHQSPLKRSRHFGRHHTAGNDPKHRQPACDPMQVAGALGLAVMKPTKTKSPKKILWGAEEIGRAIDRSERSTFYLLESGAIECARKVGNKWCAPYGALLREFGAEDSQ